MNLNPATVIDAAIEACAIEQTWLNDLRSDDVGNVYKVHVEDDSEPTYMIQQSGLILFSDPSEYGMRVETSCAEIEWCQDPTGSCEHCAWRETSIEDGIEFYRRREAAKQWRRESKWHDKARARGYFSTECVDDLPF